MKLIIQRVTHAEVSVEGNIIGQIEKGILVLVGACQGDTVEIADKMLHKMLNLRIFADADGKTNLSLKDAGGAVLMISQFTLYADCRKGNRPSFIKAGPPEEARLLYEHMIEKCRDCGYETQTGEFGAHMEVSLLNDGPFTIILDSAEII